MSLHGLLAVIIGVPNVHETAAYYAGFSEYYSDMDCIIDDQLWTPGELEGARGLFAWRPPPPSFPHPEDLAAMMTGARSARYSVR